MVSSGEFFSDHVLGQRKQKKKRYRQMRREKETDDIEEEEKGEKTVFFVEGIVTRILISSTGSCRSQSPAIQRCTQTIDMRKTERERESIRVLFGISCQHLENGEYERGRKTSRRSIDILRSNEENLTQNRRRRCRHRGTIGQDGVGEGGGLALDIVGIDARQQTRGWLRKSW